MEAWRMRSNVELQNAYKLPDIVTEIKIRRLEWLEHLVGVEKIRMEKIVINTKPEGRRRVARPKLRWLDNVETDIKTLHIKIWRLKAEDRKGWTVILREAKAKLKVS
jgi:hypothetical protein